MSIKESWSWNQSIIERYTSATFCHVPSEADGKVEKLAKSGVVEEDIMIMNAQPSNWKFPENILDGTASPSSW